MQYGYHDSKDDLAKRLSRIEGQVRGVARMVDEDKYCIDILTQINAAQAALDKVSLQLLREHARHCLRDDGVSAPDGGDKADVLVDAIGRLLSR